MTILYHPNTHQLDCQDTLRVDDLRELLRHLDQQKKIKTISGQGLKELDTACAFLLIDFAEREQAQFVNFSPLHQSLLELVKKHAERVRAFSAEEKPPSNFFHRFGERVVNGCKMLLSYFHFLGRSSSEWHRLWKKGARFRWKSMLAQVFYTGTCALPIIALLSVMVGVVITYQMGLQLKNYGANIFIVDLLGLSILREFSPLLTAIMVAGRTGSSFTAELGIMKMNEEVDALNTMGITAEESLFLPRIIALTIALPLLTMWANIFGIFGGMLMSSNMLNVTWYDFLNRFQMVIPLRALLIGIGKAPVFALIIATVSCYLGSMVKGSADSIGRNTTRSVVLAIFFIILADAVFSVLFSHFKL